ncbi:hypothetical protein [Methanolobus psychrotolerans]|uniref:hypothetical protein n=1 Tax=Methanolobus psychrotolerans TaxID=1874706 RepID=UPI000B9186AF|nr:hypothetical protein [Methanolobus psychrotolerans]
MTGDKTSEISRKEIADLARTGNELMELMEKVPTSDHEYQKNRNMFLAEYNRWYTRCLPIIRGMLPDKALRFESLYHTNKRSGTNEYTYTIQDYIQGVYFKDKPKSYTDNITAKRLKEQNSILQTALPRVSSFSFEMEKFVKINPIHGQPSSSISNQDKLIDIDFSDGHYNSIKAEINSSYKRGFFMASFLLSKELIRNLLIDLIRTEFPPTSDERISYYYDLKNSTYKEAGQLLKVLTEKKEEFDINPDAIERIIKMIVVIEPKMKPDSHSFKLISTREEMDMFEIEEIVGLINDIIEFMKK